MIATMTMIGQFSQGIDFHIRNLKWFLKDVEHHIYIVTTHKVKPTENVTWLPRPLPSYQFPIDPHTGFIHYWKWFPVLLPKSDWVLLMEQDIYFYEPFDCLPEDKKIIKNFLREKSEYHNLMAGEQVLLPRVWEGAQAISYDVLRAAANAGVQFDAEDTDLDVDQQFGCPIYLSRYTYPDTLDQLTIFCGLNGVRMCSVPKALHLRGPETLDRLFPDEKWTDEKIRQIKTSFNIYKSLAVMYIIGIDVNVDWRESKDLKWDLKRLTKHAEEWMTKEEVVRLNELLNKS